MNKKTKNLRLHMRVSVSLIWIGAIVTLLSGSVGRWCLWAGLAMAVVGVIYNVVMLRCPCCGAALSGTRNIPPRCPKCGEALE